MMRSRGSKKRWQILLCICLIPLFVIACGSKNTDVNETVDANGKSGVNAIVEQLYTGSYRYEHQIITVEGNDTTSVSFTGTRTNDPYEEHVIRENTDEDSTWTEVIYSGSGDKVRAKIKVGDNWVEQKVRKPHLYGYGHELTFTFDREEDLDGVKCQVYKTEYKETVSDGYGLKEEITASVSQEYYLAENRILKIETDLTDEQAKIGICNDMSANGTSYEDAQQKWDNKERKKSIQLLDIVQIK